MAGLFMLFSGAQMEAQWIYEYEKRRFEYVTMPGNFRCTQNLGIALEYALKDSKNKDKDAGESAKQLKPVLFVMTCQNYHRFNGISMASEAFSAYPREQEVLLNEDFKCYVLKTQQDFLIQNEFDSFKPFNGQFITIIHFFHRNYSYEAIEEGRYE